MHGPFNPQGRSRKPTLPPVWQQVQGLRAGGGTRAEDEGENPWSHKGAVRRRKQQESWLAKGRKATAFFIVLDFNSKVRLSRLQQDRNLLT
jgi:hypothetical protein